ncbi:MAG: methylthioadenosine phosphorylase [Omnitrophica WOR_2 bacterium GWA2_47_8]|nr:MAG: methylthioadenosine phosphorylase [Omnitrophica WOR_2 bacterium GWA2_47_8]
MTKVGIIGGSGLYEIEGFSGEKEVSVTTPFGKTSDKLITGKLDGVSVVFLPRHGKGHRINPTEVNYRANIYAMKELGVDAVISVTACGSLKEAIKPLDFVVPDQFVDRTNKNRASTFFEGGIVAHVAFAEPFSGEIRKILIDSAKGLKLTVHEKGTYLNMEGPQFSTKAESNLYRSWGMDIIGMTNLTEAKLAREAEISYASLAAVTDYDCWHPEHDSVTIEMIIQYLTKNAENAKRILKAAVPKIGKLKAFSAQDALKFAIVTNPKLIPAKKKKDLAILIGKYIK